MAMYTCIIRGVSDEHMAYTSYLLSPGTFITFMGNTHIGVTFESDYCPVIFFVQHGVLGLLGSVSDCEGLGIHCMYPPSLSQLRRVHIVMILSGGRLAQNWHFICLMYSVYPRRPMGA